MKTVTDVNKTALKEKFATHGESSVSKCGIHLAGLNRYYPIT